MKGKYGCLLAIVAVVIGIILSLKPRDNKDIYSYANLNQNTEKVKVSKKVDKVYVYICTGPQSKRYHKSPNCYGLSKCSDEIIRVTIEEARDDYYRTPCGYCYK